MRIKTSPAPFNQTKSKRICCSISRSRFYRAKTLLVSENRQVNDPWPRALLKSKHSSHPYNQSQLKHGNSVFVVMQSEIRWRSVIVIYIYRWLPVELYPESSSQPSTACSAPMEKTLPSQAGRRTCQWRNFWHSATWRRSQLRWPSKIPRAPWRPCWKFCRWRREVSCNRPEWSPWRRIEWFLGGGGPWGHHEF